MNAKRNGRRQVRMGQPNEHGWLQLWWKNADDTDVNEDQEYYKNELKEERAEDSQDKNEIQDDYDEEEDEESTYTDENNDDNSFIEDDNYSDFMFTQDDVVCNLQQNQNIIQLDLLGYHINYWCILQNQDIEKYFWCKSRPDPYAE